MSNHEAPQSDRYYAPTRGVTTMFRHLIAAFAVLAGVVATMIGLTSAAHAATSAPTVVNVQGSMIDQCRDGRPVWLDLTTLTIYGDQDGNGLLDGDDCNWN